MQELMMFQGNKVELLKIDEEIYFNPYDVGRCLGLCDSAIRMAISKMNKHQAVKLTKSIVKDIDNYNIPPSGKLFLTECGVYKLIFKSNKPKAEEFANWVTDVVLPSIRKTGTYTTPNAKQQIEQKEYTYIDKYYKGQLVITFRDLEHFTGIDHRNLRYYFCSHEELFNCGVDYWLLKDVELARFKKENPKFYKLVSSLFVITKNGFDKLARLVEGINIKLACFNQKCESKQDGSIHMNESVRILLNNTYHDITTIETLVRAFDSYNTAEQYNTYQKAILEVGRTLYQKLVAIGSIDVEDSNINIISLRKENWEFQNERKRIFAPNKTCLVGYAKEKSLLYLF